MANQTEGVNMDLKLPFKPNDKMRELLDDLKGGRFTQAEFQTECAYWSLEFIEDCRVRYFPNPPQDIIKVREKRKMDPKYDVSQEFWLQAHIQAYLRTFSFVVYRNFKSIGRLKLMLGGLPAGDTMNRDRIKKMLDAFGPWIAEYKQIVRIHDYALKQEPIGQAGPTLEETEEDFFGNG